MRLKRKNRTYKEIGYKTSCGITDLLDNAMKEFLRVNDKEYDYILSRMTDEEMQLLVQEEFTFAEKRKILTIVEKYLDECEEK